MRSKIFTSLVILMMFGATLSAQDSGYPEKFGKTLNLGIGIGYYGYVGHPMPVLHADFEIDVVRNLTIAPFVNVYTYRKYHYWGDQDHPYREYYYRETVIPVGAKVSYYFDELLQAGPKWDFYVGSSLGFSIRNSRWENGYYGRHDVYHPNNSLYVDMHIGAEYHLNRSIGLLLDLSTGVSTIGLGIHF